MVDLYSEADIFGGFLGGFVGWRIVECMQMPHHFCHWIHALRKWLLQELVEG